MMWKDRVVRKKSWKRWQQCFEAAPRETIVLHSTVQGSSCGPAQQLSMSWRFFQACLWQRGGKAKPCCSHSPAHPWHSRQSWTGCTWQRCWPRSDPGQQPRAAGREQHCQHHPDTPSHWVTHRENKTAKNTPLLFNYQWILFRLKPINDWFGSWSPKSQG